MVVALAISGVVLLVMVGVSWYGWISLPRDARVPVHWLGSYNNFVSKRLGLIIHPAAGALIFLLLALAALSIPIGYSPTRSAAPAVLLPIVMCVLLVTQVGAIRVARRRSGV
ncbi:MAG TPA: hypothetical protein VIX86_10810 [Streptosporangiaceae bacterium]